MLKFREKKGPPGYLEVEEPAGSGNWVDYFPGESDGPSLVKTSRTTESSRVRLEEQMGKSAEEQLQEANREIARLKADRDKPRRKVYVGHDRYGTFYADAETKDPVTAQEAADCEIVNAGDKYSAFVGNSASRAQIFEEQIKRGGRR